MHVHLHFHTVLCLVKILSAEFKGTKSRLLDGPVIYSTRNWEFSSTTTIRGQKMGKVSLRSKIKRSSMWITELGKWIEEPAFSTLKMKQYFVFSTVMTMWVAWVKKGRKKPLEWNYPWFWKGQRKKSQFR